MKKILLAVTALTFVVGVLPAQAAVSTYVRTITAPTHLSNTGSPFSLPSILSSPTNPDDWEKLGVVFARARCAYVKQQAGVLPAGTAQDGTGGKLGYVFALPSGFGSGDSFTLKSVGGTGGNPTQYDFDVTFYSSLGVCVPDEEVEAPAGIGHVATVPLEGQGPKPDADYPCNIKNTFSTVFDDSGTVGSTVCPFDAQFAIVVMPIGANGKFEFKITY